jgi:hypothetical protein
MLRAVAATLSPRFKNASAQSFPNPLDSPVIKIVLLMMLFVFVYFDMTKLISPLGERLTHISGRIAQKYERGRFVVESLIYAT